MDEDNNSIATSTYSYIEDGSSIMSYPYCATNNNALRQFSFEEESESSLRGFSMPDQYNINNVSLDTIKSSSDSLNESSYMSNLTTDSLNNNKDATKTSGVRELFGLGVLGGDQEEVPPPMMNGASILPEEEEDDDDEMGSASYDGHLALSNYYGDKNPSFSGSFGEDGVASQAFPVATNYTDDSDKEDAPNETMDDEDDDGVSVDVNNEEQSTSTKDQSQYGEDYSLRSAVSVASSIAKEEEKNGGGEVDGSDVESLDDDKTEEREQDDASD
jgi:hypothetical protein